MTSERCVEVREFNDHRRWEDDYPQVAGGRRA